MLYYFHFLFFPSYILLNSHDISFPSSQLDILPSRLDKLSYPRRNKELYTPLVICLVFYRRYSMMQSDGNSCKIHTFREAITSELMISCRNSEKSTSSVFVSSKSIFFFSKLIQTYCLYVLCL